MSDETYSSKRMREAERDRDFGRIVDLHRSLGLAIPCDKPRHGKNLLPSQEFGRATPKIEIPSDKAALWDRMWRWVRS